MTLYRLEIKESYDQNLHSALRISNAFLEHQAFSTALESFQIQPERAQELLLKVQFEFTPHTAEFYSQIQPISDETNLTIYISDFFPRRYQRLENETSNLHDNREYQTLIFFEAAAILHQVGHLLNRWAGLDDSFDQRTEAGYFLEDCMFGYELYLAFKDNPDPAQIQTIGIVVEPFGIERLVKEDYIEKVFKRLVLGEKNIRVNFLNVDYDLNRPIPENVKWKPTEADRVRLQSAEVQSAFQGKVTIAKGLCQRAKKRNELIENIKVQRKIATMLSNKCVNPDTKRSYTVGVIEQAMNEANILVNTTESVEQQARETIQRLQTSGILLIKCWPESF